MEKLIPWFALKSVHGVGNCLFKRLIDRFKSPERTFEASQDELLAVEGITRGIGSSILSHKIPDQVKKDLDLVNKKGYKILTMADTDYPPLLLQIPDPPPFLYICGHLTGSLKKVAVVGSRNATDYGIVTTIRLCKDLCAHKITIASGMAKGIDTAAHQGALMGKGKTIAVLGSGLERIYPAQNRKLFYEITENGAVVSEFPLLTEPEAHNFPRRNRIISGMSLGTVIVEAAQKSGSLITARLAAEQNREVFAVPGSINSFKSTGAHKLIKQGAKLVEHARDIIEEIEYMLKPCNKNNKSNLIKTNQPPDLSHEESIVYKALGPYPIHIDDLVRKISLETGKLSSILLKLELKGIVLQSPGKIFTVSDSLL